MTPMESISLGSFGFARASSHVAYFNTGNTLLTKKLLKQDYRYHKLHKTFSKLLSAVFLYCRFFLFLKDVFSQIIFQFSKKCVFLIKI